MDANQGNMSGGNIVGSEGNTGVDIPEICHLFVLIKNAKLNNNVSMPPKIEEIAGNWLMFSKFLFFNVFHVLFSVVVADKIQFVIGIIVFGWVSNVFNIYVCVKARIKFYSGYRI